MNIIKKAYRLLYLGSAIGISVIFSTVTAQEITRIKIDENKINSYLSKINLERNSSTKIYLAKVEGGLYVKAPSTVDTIVDTFEVYFHIPISFEDQVPVHFEVWGHYLKDYRFVKLSPPNFIIAARINPCLTTGIYWTAWVLIKDNTYSDIPSFVPFPTHDQIPDSVKKWLEPTDCIQSNAPVVISTVEEVKRETNDLNTFAKNISSFCRRIPWVDYPASHEPIAYDAVYAINWGSSCTGKAHTGAALFRARGIPARVLLNILPFSEPMDHHWAIQYYVPDYGWVRMETTLGMDRVHPIYNIVTMVCNPEDEFPVFSWNGVENQWHTSDPAFGTSNPIWKSAHSADLLNTIETTTDTVNTIFALTDSVFFYNTLYHGIHLDSSQQTYFQTGANFQQNALTKVQNNDLGGFIDDIQQSLNNYYNVKTEPLTTIFFDDFEDGAKAWTHGGEKDRWELGTSGYGPPKAHSGSYYWGMELNNEYPSNADCWLKTRPVYLTDYRCAYLEFWLWNSVEEENHYTIIDPFWLDITKDGTTFHPLCSPMGGINDDPMIPNVGGWSMVALDLTRFVGDTVQIRFRFESNETIEKAGPYIDDVHVYGIYKCGTDTTQPKDPEEQLGPIYTLFQSYPNPCNNLATIKFALHKSSFVNLTIYNILGNEVAELVNEKKDIGVYNVEFNGKEVSSGVYIYKFTVDGYSDNRKFILLK